MFNDLELLFLKFPTEKTWTNKYFFFPEQELKKKYLEPEPRKMACFRNIDLQIMPNAKWWEIFVSGPKGRVLYTKFVPPRRAIPFLVHASGAVALKSGASAQHCCYLF